jgi:hypothetical protein
MNPSFSDPNNHVPELSPDDGWDDAEVHNPDSPAAATTALPPRRNLADRPAGGSAVAVDEGQPGLRIEANLTRGELLETPTRLEVQEINSSVVRLEPTASPPPMAPRKLTFHERPVQASTGGEGATWGFVKRHQGLWVVSAGVGVVVIVIGTMLLLPFINSPDGVRPGSGMPMTRVFIEEKMDGIEAMNQLLSKQPEAMQIYRSFATASYPDEIIPLIRDGAALRDTLRSRWRSRAVSKQWAPDAKETSWNILELAGQPCGLLQGSFPDQSTYTAYFTNDGGKLLLDWKATVAFGTATFGELAKGLGDSAEIRGEVSISDFYSANWPEADYQSYRLVSPDGEISIWCYARLGDEANNQIARLLRPGEITGEAKSSQKVTLRLERGPAGSPPNQWLIGETLHIDWVTR